MKVHSSAAESSLLQRTTPPFFFLWNKLQRSVNEEVQSQEKRQLKSVEAFPPFQVNATLLSFATNRSNQPLSKELIDWFSIHRFIICCSYLFRFRENVLNSNQKSRKVVARITVKKKGFVMEKNAAIFEDFYLFRMAFRHFGCVLARMVEVEQAGKWSSCQSKICFTVFGDTVYELAL